jgi:hypothetical protein
MVPPPLRSILLRHDSYLVDGNVATADDDVCLICREPYSRKGEVGCRAIRIVHCGHIIGYQCLEDWIARRPDTCPYFDHQLPPSRIPEARARDTSIDWIEEVLTYICDTTPWILFNDDFIAAIQYGAHTSAEHALCALDQDRLTPAYARLLRCYCSAYVGSYFHAAGIILGSCILISYALRRTGFLGWVHFPYASSVKLMIVVAGILALLAVPFLIVMEAIVRLGLRRSMRGRNGL